MMVFLSSSCYASICGMSFTVLLLQSPGLLTRTDALTLHPTMICRLPSSTVVGTPTEERLLSCNGIGNAYRRSNIRILVPTPKVDEPRWLGGSASPYNKQFFMALYSSSNDDQDCGSTDNKDNCNNDEKNNREDLHTSKQGDRSNEKGKMGTNPLYLPDQEDESMTWKDSFVNPKFIAQEFLIGILYMAQIFFFVLAFAALSSFHPVLLKEILVNPLGDAMKAIILFKLWLKRKTIWGSIGAQVCYEILCLFYLHVVAKSKHRLIPILCLLLTHPFIISRKIHLFYRSNLQQSFQRVVND